MSDSGGVIMEQWEFCRVKTVTYEAPLFGANAYKIVVTLLTPEGYSVLMETEPEKEAFEGSMDKAYRQTDKVIAKLGQDGWEPVEWRTVFKRKVDNGGQ
jgi:hypothetical protein